MGKKKSIYQWMDPIDPAQKNTTFNMVKATPGAMNELSNTYYTRLAALESSNNPGSINDYGYIGKYQMGAGALVDTGYLKKEAYSKGNKSMNDSSMWTGKNNIRSIQDFLANEREQDAAVRAYTYRNRVHLTSSKIGDVNAIEAAKALGIDTDALLASSHLLGAEGMKNYVSDLYQLKNATASDDYDLTAVQDAYGRLSGYKDANGKTAADRIKEFGGSIDIDFDKIQSIIPSDTNDTQRESLEKLPSIGEPINDIAAVEESVSSLFPASAIFQTKSNTMEKNNKEKPSAIDRASNMALATNIANIGASIAGGLYSMWQVNKMKTPEVVVPEKVEAVRIGDRGAALEASGRMSIDRGIATSRNALQRSGRTDLLPTITAGETASTNQLSGSVEQMRLQIDQMNAAAEARAREINASAKSQTSLFNNQTLQSFQQMKSQLGTQAISTMGQNISANASAISSNAFGKAMYEDQTQKQEKSIYMSMLNSPDQAIRAQGFAALKKLNKG